MTGKNGGFVAGLLTGALVGASLAMVLVPPSGEDMRDRLRAKSREAAGRSLGAPAETPS